MIFSTIINNLYPRFFTQLKGHKPYISYQEAKKAKEKLVDTLFKKHNVVSMGVYEQRDFKGRYL